jgi:pyruvate ferredoxin oxidoreductase beta subunit
MIQNLPEEEYWASGHRACAGCGASIAMRHATKAAGKNTIVVNATGCMEVVSTPYPQTAWKLPYIHGAFENAAAIASGVCEALKKQKKDSKVLVIAGDGGTFDIGLQALSGAVERNHDFCFICYDNAAYMNTGIQRSGATPKYAATTTSPAGKVIHGKVEWKKKMPFIIAGHHENVYVATANIGFPQDFYKKVKKGLEFKGPAYIQVYTPCVPGWKYDPALTIDLCKRAFNAKVTPLYEIENGVLKFTQKPNKFIPFLEYTKGQGRFKHLNDKEIKEVQQHLDKEYNRLINLEKSGLNIF